MSPIGLSDRDYQAENDVNILEEAAAIEDDEGRKDRARQAADTKIKHLQEVRKKVFPKTKNKAFDGSVANSFVKGK